MKAEIKIEGKKYPARQTGGALLRFKRETGYDVVKRGSEIDSSDLVILAWCCTASACNADGVEFKMSLMEFADRVTPEEVNRWFLSVNPGVAPEDSKKKE